MNSTACLSSVRYNITFDFFGNFGMVEGIAERPTDCSGKVD